MRLGSVRNQAQESWVWYIATPANVWVQRVVEFKGVEFDILLDPHVLGLNV